MITEGQFKSLYDNWYYKIFIYAKKKIISDDICQDIVTDAFIKMWERRSKINFNNGRANLVYQEVSFRIADYYKTLNRHGRKVELNEEYELVPEDKNAFIEAEFLASIYENMARIPKRQRQVLQCFLKGLSTPEIANVLNISTQNVLASKTYGINRLKQLLHV